MPNNLVPANSLSLQSNPTHGLTLTGEFTSIHYSDCAVPPSRFAGSRERSRAIHQDHAGNLPRHP
jgi:hypothetical protein